MSADRKRWANEIKETSREEVWHRLQTELPDIFGDTADNSIKGLFKGATSLKYAGVNGFNFNDTMSVVAIGTSLPGMEDIELRVYEGSYQEKHIDLSFRKNLISDDLLFVSWEIESNKKESESVYVNYGNQCDATLSADKISTKFAPPKKERYKYGAQLPFGEHEEIINIRGKESLLGGSKKDLISIYSVKPRGENEVSITWADYPSRGASYRLTLPISVGLSQVSV